MTMPRSVTVPLLAGEQIAEVKTIRILLEGDAAAIAAKKATATQIDDIAEINDTFFASLRGGDTRKESELNRKFHLAVVAVAEMPIVLSTVEVMWARMGALIHRINLDLRASRNYGPDHEHYRVIEGLRLRNPELAKLSIQNDIRLSRVGILMPRDEEARATDVRPRRRRRKADILHP
jgi:DNA-binding GntR family transcriptional regulator